MAVDVIRNSGPQIGAGPPVQCPQSQATVKEQHDEKLVEPAQYAAAMEMRSRCIWMARCHCCKSSQGPTRKPMQIGIA